VGGEDRAGGAGEMRGEKEAGVSTRGRGRRQGREGA